MMLRLERNLLHLCPPTFRADKLMLIHEHKGHMITDANMTQLNMVGIMDLHSAATAITCKVLSVEIQVPMKAICFSASTGSLFGRSIVNEISKIIGKKEHIWKICS